MEKIEVTKVIKALIVARKGGMPIEDLDSKFLIFFFKFIYLNKF